MTTWIDRYLLPWMDEDGYYIPPVASRWSARQDTWPRDSIAWLDLPERVFDAWVHTGYTLQRDLRRLSDAQILAEPWIGPKSLAVLRKALRARKWKKKLGLHNFDEGLMDRLKLSEYHRGLAYIRRRLAGEMRQSELERLLVQAMDAYVLALANVDPAAAYFYRPVVEVIARHIQTNAETMRDYAEHNALLLRAQWDAALRLCHTLMYDEDWQRKTGTLSWDSTLDYARRLAVGALKASVAAYTLPDDWNTILGALDTGSALSVPPSPYSQTIAEQTRYRMESAL